MLKMRWRSEFGSMPVLPENLNLLENDRFLFVRFITINTLVLANG
jgi:hypothetical protein